MQKAHRAQETEAAVVSRTALPFEDDVLDLKATLVASVWLRRPGLVGTVLAMVRAIRRHPSPAAVARFAGLGN